MKAKRFVAAVMALLLCLTLFAGCSSSAGNEDNGDNVIRIGMLGPYTGDYAVYGLAVKNGATLYVDELNANGGINGKTVELISYDHKGDSAEAVTVFNRLVDEDGIVALIGDVLTDNTIAIVGEAYPLNLPMVTASATADAVTYDSESDTVFTNVYRTCFLDSFQGRKMAQYSYEVLNAQTAAIIYQTGNDYSIGLKDAFVAECELLGIEVVKIEAYSAGDTDFNSQLTNINAANPDIVFCPNYYQDDGMIISQARRLGITATFVGGDGWNGVSDFASAEDLEGTVYCSAYASGTTDDVIAFEEAYITAFDEESLNMFSALSYDAAMVLCNAIAVAEEAGLEAGTDEYEQAVIDAIRDNSGDLVGITSPDGYEFDEFNNPIKSAVIIKLVDGEEAFSQMF